MKYRDVIQALVAAGFTLEEGGKHTLVLRDGYRVSAVPRHREVKTGTVRSIERQTGVSILRKQS